MRLHTGRRNVVFQHHEYFCDLIKSTYTRNVYCKLCISTQYNRSEYSRVFVNHISDGMFYCMYHKCVVSLLYESENVIQELQSFQTFEDIGNTKMTSHQHVIYHVSLVLNNLRNVFRISYMGTVFHPYARARVFSSFNKVVNFFRHMSH